MSEEKTIVRPDNPFDDDKSGDNKGADNSINFPDVMGKDKPAEQKPENKPAKPEESGVLEVPKLEEKKPAQPAKPEKAEPAADVKKEGTDRGAEKVESAPKEKANVQTNKEIQSMYEEVRQLEQSIAQLYVKATDKDGKEVIQLRTDKIKDAQGQELTAEQVQSQLLARISMIHETAIQKADAAMKNPEAVLGEALATKKQYEDQRQTTKNLLGDLQKQGVDPSVDGYLDKVLLNRFIAQSKDLKPEVKAKLDELKQSLDKQNQLDQHHKELVVLQQTPIITRHANSEFLSKIGNTSVAADVLKDAERVSLQLNSPAGRSEFMREAVQRIEKAKDNGLDQKIQDKYLNNPDNPFKLIQAAHEKAAKGDLDGARKDLEQARTNSKKFDPEEVKKDFAEIQKRADELVKEKDALAKRHDEGKATPAELLRYQEKEAKLRQEAAILEAFHLAKPKADLAYADFLLNADKNKDSEANRKFARDILMNMRFDELGKAVAAQSAELFDKNFEKAMNGNVDNRATLMAFNQKMAEFANEMKKASEKDDPEEIAKGLLAARGKAEEAKDIASKINRDAANENEMRVRENLQKLLQQEQGKPAAEQDKGKIRLLSEIMKPANQQDKQIVDLLVNSLSPNPDKAKVDQLMGMVKDPRSMTDVIGGFQLIKQSEFQRQAVNNARMAMLDIDINLDRGENNPLVAEIENDKYGAEVIGQLNAQAGHDGRTKWGDIKEATRDLAWYENAWKWLKGNIKDIAISLASGVVGIAAGLGVGALTSWTGPGLVVAGGAAGFAAAAGTSAALHKLCGDKFSWSSTVLDGIGGASGGAFAAARTVTSIAGKEAIARVSLAAAGGEAAVATSGKEVLQLGTWQAFKLAGSADKVAIALGGNRFLSTMSSSLVGSAVYRYPTELLTGNYQSTGDWLKGSTLGVGRDMMFSPLGAYLNMRTGAGGDALAKQIAYDYFMTSPLTTKGRNPEIRPNGVNSWLVPKPERVKPEEQK
ncbi:MAG: hypothetical protein K2X77_09825 [Candidatus Obscuribacterales bacterium]|nr:hypothetical protein [Candidatus Obscuribacterales bacterium]